MPLPAVKVLTTSALRKSMTEIVQPWPMASGRRPQADLSRQPVKSTADLGAIQTVASQGYKEVGRGTSRQEAVTATLVIP